MNTEHDWLVWWHDEGSGMRPINGQDHESHVRDMTRIAWLNGAFGAADEIERLRAERDEARRASAAWEANLAEPQEIDPADLQALIDATWKDDRLTVRMSARDLWRMATDRRGREEE